MPRVRLRASGPLAQLPSSLSDRHARGRGARRMVDVVDYHLGAGAVLDCGAVYGPEPETLEDEERERQRQRFSVDDFRQRSLPARSSVNAGVKMHHR